MFTFVPESHVTGKYLLDELIPAFAQPAPCVGLLLYLLTCSAPSPDPQVDHKVTRKVFGTQWTPGAPVGSSSWHIFQARFIVQNRFEAFPTPRAEQALVTVCPSEVVTEEPP